MANIRVYELARDLNMKNKALLEKLKELDVPVRSHMSSLDDDTVNTIKAKLRGKKAGGMEDIRVKPTIIRRRGNSASRKSAGEESTEPMAASEEAASAPAQQPPAEAGRKAGKSEAARPSAKQPAAEDAAAPAHAKTGMRADTKVGPEKDAATGARASSDAAAPKSTHGAEKKEPEKKSKAKSTARTGKKSDSARVISLPESTRKPAGKPAEAAGGAGAEEPESQAPAAPKAGEAAPEAAEVGKAAAGKPDSAHETPAEAASGPAAEKAPERADAIAADKETAPATDKEQAPSADKTAKNTGNTASDDRASAEADQAPTDQAPADKASDDSEGKAPSGEPAKESEEPAKESDAESADESKDDSKDDSNQGEKPSRKKKKKSRKDTPAKIIKLPTQPVASLKKETPAAQEPAARAEDAGGDSDAGEDRHRRGKRPAAAAPEDAAAKDKKPRENRWAKKKISFKRKEVVEGADLYAGSARRGKGRKGAKVKPAPSQKTQITTPKAIKRRIKVDDTIALSDLAKRMGIKANEIIMKLMGQGIMVTVNQTLDFETASLVAAEFGYEAERAAFEEEALLKTTGTDDPEKMAERPPVVTIMGHVDHGKTSLLDVIRKTRITENEAGGITQHIGAYYVETEGGQIVFLDTPGHEAFTAMRARGATVTDIVVLVVAADDGVMPQTVEAINHSRAAEVPIIVAVNKIDKANADPDKVMRELSEQGLVPEAWGGDTIFVMVSAKQAQGINELLEMILLQSEVLELKANPEKLAVGYVVEAKLDAGRGPVATVLIQDGTLRAGDAVVCGIHHGKIRALINDRSVQVDSAGPSIPVEILGLSGVPNAGDEMVSLADDKSAKQVSDHRMQKQRSVELAKTSRMNLEKLFEKMQKGEVKDLNLIIKADVHGSIEALKDSLTKLSNEEVAIHVIHAATGTVSESDVSLAAVSNAIILGFNVRPSAKVQSMASEEQVDMRFYNVIYNAIKDIQDAIVGMMSSTFEERVVGSAAIREVFHVPKVGSIAGSYVTDGKIQRGLQIRLIRDGIVIYSGKIGSLRRFKDDVKEVASGYECGIGIENFNDLKVNDVMECFFMEEIKPELTSS